MGKPRGSIGETKLKILAILQHNEGSGIHSHGYAIWKTLQEQYCSCLGNDGLRNVYHHLHDLQDLGIINLCSNLSTQGMPERRSYNLTEKSSLFNEKLFRYLKVLQTVEPYKFDRSNSKQKAQKQ